MSTEKIPEWKVWEASRALHMLHEKEAPSVHEERALGDPLYNAFVCPDFERFMDHTIEALVEFFYAKYGRDKLGEPCHASVRNVFEQVLANPTRDPVPRLFFMLCALHREPQFQRALKLMYRADKPTLVARGKQETRFVQFVCYLQHIVERALRTPYNKHNIVHIVTQTNAHLMRQYLMGTLKIN